MAQGAAESLFDELSPVVAALGLDLVDVEVSASTVRVTVDCDGGIDLDALADANRAVSSALDRLDPISGRYTLEVSSPGVERRLRTPAHFERAVGETVAVRLLPAAAEERRLQGQLVAADEAGVSIRLEGGDASVPYDQIERARTVFEWGAKPAPSPSRGKGSKSKERVRTP